MIKTHIKKKEYIKLMKNVDKMNLVKRYIYVKNQSGYRTNKIIQ